MGHAESIIFSSFWYLSLVLGLEAKVGGEGGFWGTWILSCLGNPSSKVIALFLSNVRTFSSGTVGVVNLEGTGFWTEYGKFSPGKVVSSIFKNLASLDSADSSQIFSFQFMSTYSFLIRNITLTADTVHDLCRDSTSHIMKAWVWFSAPSALWLKDRRFSINSQFENFTLIFSVWTGN